MLYECIKEKEKHKTVLVDVNMLVQEWGKSCLRLWAAVGCSSNARQLLVFWIVECP